MGKLTFSDYELYFYGSVIKANPQQIISRDNNKEILGACVSPRTKKQLYYLKVSISDIQIALLKKWGLLEAKGELLQTSFPILGRGKISKLREYTKTTAPAIIKNINSELSDFLITLTQQSKINPYLLFFTYVADDLVWGCFTKERKMPDMTMYNKKRLWRGILWGSYSPRSFFLGTNEYPVEDGVVKFIWNNDLLPKLEPFFLHREAIPQMIKNLSIPPIYQKSGDLVYENSLKLANKLARETLKHLKLPSLTKQYKFHNDKETLVIVYHELMWSLLEEMEKSGLLVKPPIINNPHRLKKINIAELIFKIYTN